MLLKVLTRMFSVFAGAEPSSIEMVIIKHLRDKNNGVENNGLIFDLCNVICHFSSSQTHVYESIQDENNEELLPPRQPRREAPNNTDSFYDLLQAVN